MNSIGSNGWMPGLLVFKGSNLSSGSSTTIVVSIDKTIKFKAMAMTGFAHKYNDPTTPGYFTIDSITLGSYARKIITGASLHSNYFERFTAMPVRFEGAVLENTDININVTNVSTSIAIDIYIVMNGSQIQV